MSNDHRQAGRRKETNWAEGNYDRQLLELQRENRYGRTRRDHKFPVSPKDKREKRGTRMGHWAVSPESSSSYGVFVGS